MDVGAAIIDISSDEENCIDDSFDITDEWITELLESVDKDMEGDFNDVMILDELSTPSCTKKPSPLQRDSDDDCLVLDGDPDKPMSVVDGSVDGFDDLLIVGEKGHLACRDYPHPRHLCVNFPFNSTPHEKHCKMCHCYVCDSPAPCIYWGIGLSASDHCHSNEKEKQWKTLRAYIKLGLTDASEPQWFPSSKQSRTQPFRSSQDIYNLIPGSQNTNWCSTTGSATTIPNPSVQREHQLLGSSLCCLRAVPVNQRTLRIIDTRSYPNNHTVARTLSAPINFGNRVDESLGISAQDCSVSNQMQRSVSQRAHHSSVLLDSQTKHPASPHANRQPIQTETSADMARIRGILASIEADLFDSDYSSGGIAESNMSSVSSTFPALSKPSVLTSANQNLDIYGAYYPSKNNQLYRPL